jgi:hypothetical protein
MRVYIVTGGEHEDYRIFGAYSSKESAISFVEKEVEKELKVFDKYSQFRTRFNIEEYILDE